jgi:UPF0716 family protein affecting phage T7 exclusion
MTKRKGTEGQETQWLVLLVLMSFSFGHCVACPSVLFFWPLCCLSFCPFLLDIVLLVLLSFSFGHYVEGTEGQATQWSKENDRRTGNTMTKRK